jgi:L-asparaginase
MKRRVHVLGTGGTIAGAQPDPGHYGYTAAKYGIDWLLNAVPGLDRLAILSGEQVVNIGSQDMDDATWLQLARRLDAVLAAEDVDAALVTHGTDTLEETSYFLSLVTASDKPVVMVGSMRPATAISADGPANIYNGVAVAADPGAVGRGTLVVLNDEIHYARNAVKTGTSNPSAFSSMSRGLAGVTSSGRVEWFEQAPPAGGRSVRFAVGAIDVLPRVDILHAHANMSVDLIDAAIAGGARGG